MKKIIVLASILIMSLGLVACEKKEEEKRDIDVMNEGNEIVTINGKTYGLSKDCGEIMQEFVDDMYIEHCPFENEQPLRKVEAIKKYDEELGFDQIIGQKYFQLDKDGEYVEMEPEEFDERVYMMLVEHRYDNDIGSKGKIGELCWFSIKTDTRFNNPDFEIFDPNGIGIGSTIGDLINAGAYIDEYTDSSTCYIIYLDGELVKFSDYRRDVDRIRNMNSSTWKQEKEKEFKYAYLGLNFVPKNCNEYKLAESDAKSQLASGKKETMLIFTYYVEDGTIDEMSFTVMKQSEVLKEHYMNFDGNK